MITISKDELTNMIDKERRDVVLIDVLSNDAFKKQHIPMSINIPGDQPQFVQMVMAVTGDKYREIVLYSSGFECGASSNAARKLQEAGFARIYDFQGGTAEWFGERQSAPTGTNDVPRQHKEWLEVVGGEPKPS